MSYVCTSTITAQSFLNGKLCTNSSLQRQMVPCCLVACNGEQNNNKTVEIQATRLSDLDGGILYSVLICLNNLLYKIKKDKYINVRSAFTAVFSFNTVLLHLLLRYLLLTRSHYDTPVFPPLDIFSNPRLVFIEPCGLRRYGAYGGGQKRSRGWQRQVCAGGQLKLRCETSFCPWSGLSICLALLAPNIPEHKARNLKGGLWKSFQHQ